MEWLPIIMFVTVMLSLIAGYPVALSLAGVSLLWGAFGYTIGIFDVDLLWALPERIYAIITNPLLVAVPLFCFMGFVLEKSKIAETLLRSMTLTFGGLPGGLGISVVIVGCLLAASTGIIGATITTMGLMSLPTMLRNGYSPSVSAGTICAAGTLGQIIPPAVVLIILTDQIAYAYQSAQQEIGNFSPTPVSVGDLFAGALLPGLLLTGLYLLYLFIRGMLDPKNLPPLKRQEDDAVNLKELLLESLLPPLILIFAVLGSILMGVATTTESASVGAIGACMLAAYRLSDDHKIKRIVKMGFWAIIVAFALTLNFDLRLSRNSITALEIIAIGAATLCTIGILYALYISYGVLKQNGVIKYSTDGTVLITAKVMAIIICVQIFALVFRAFGGDDLVHDFLKGMDGGLAAQILLVMMVIFILGMFLDFIEITLIVVPLVAPVLLQSDISPVWLGIMIAMNLQTSFMTPPFGFSLFYLRSVAPKDFKTIDIYKGVIPFLCIQILMLFIIWHFPVLTDYLPKVLLDSDYSKSGLF